MAASSSSSKGYPSLNEYSYTPDCGFCGDAPATIKCRGTCGGEVVCTRKGSECSFRCESCKLISCSGCQSLCHLHLHIMRRSDGTLYLKKLCTQCLSFNVDTNDTHGCMSSYRFSKRLCEKRRRQKEEAEQKTPGTPPSASSSVPTNALAHAVVHKKRKRAMADHSKTVSTKQTRVE